MKQKRTFLLYFHIGKLGEFSGRFGLEYLEEHIKAYVEASSDQPTPFVWKKEK